MSKRIKISEDEAKKLETIAIIALIIFAVASYLIVNFVLKKDISNISITKNNKKITQVNGKKIDLNIDGKFKIEDDNGEYNIIEIKDKKVKCIEANCPDKICMQHGYLRDDIDNDMIVCAPHKLIIQYVK